MDNQQTAAYPSLAEDTTVTRGTPAQETARTETDSVPVQVDVSVVVSLGEGDSKPLLAVTELPETPAVGNVERYGVTNKPIQKRVIFEGMLRPPTDGGKRPWEVKQQIRETTVVTKEQSVVELSMGKQWTRQAIFAQLVLNSFGTITEDDLVMAEPDAPLSTENEGTTVDTGERALVLRAQNDLAVLDGDEANAVPTEDVSPWLADVSTFDVTVLETMLADSKTKKSRFGKHGEMLPPEVLPTTPVFGQTTTTETDAVALPPVELSTLDLSLVAQLSRNEPPVASLAVPWLHPVETEKQEHVAVAASQPVPLPSASMPAFPPASFATTERSSSSTTENNLAVLTAVTALHSPLRTAVVSSDTPPQPLVVGQESLPKAKATVDTTPLLPAPITTVAVPVQTLGAGIAYALGDAVGLVVKTGREITVKVTTSTARGQRRPPVVLQTVRRPRSPSELPAYMGGRVVHGIKGVLSGSGLILHGSKEVMVGAVGCLAGAAGHLTHELVTHRQ